MNNEELIRSIVEPIVEQKVRQELAKLLGVGLAAETRKDPDCLPLSEAWQLLGYRNYRQAWRKIGTLYRVGIEAEDRRVVGAADPDWWLNIPKCKARHEQKPHRRGVG